MIALSDSICLTLEAYLQIEEKSNIKPEYIDGQVYAIAGTTDTHNTIGLNLPLLIVKTLRHLLFTLQSSFLVSTVNFDCVQLNYEKK
ncbi:hypothetical protein [Nostoc sp.]|uniref:hypothetical protein n=1 Tax=Nostoc sp. TaxID=1180 RepID=UPI002FF9082D